MHFEPTPDQSAFIHRAIADKRISAPEEALKTAMSMWEGRERRRMELLLALDAAEADIASGRYRDYADDTLPQLAEELKREGRELRNGESQ